MLRHARPSRTKNVFYWVFFYAKICKKINVFGEKQPFLCDFKALLLIFHNYYSKPFLIAKYTFRVFSANFLVNFSAKFYQIKLSYI